MTRTLFVTCLCAATLAGCGRTIVRETIVELFFESSVVRETVIERPTVALTAPASCTMGGMAYASGTLSCQGGYQHRCNNGGWERIPGTYC